MNHGFMNENNAAGGDDLEIAAE